MAARPAHGEDRSPDRFQDAVDALVGYRFAEALPKFEKVLNGLDADDRSELWQRATFGAATCLQHMTPASDDRTRRAQSMFRAIVETVPSSRLAPRSAISLGRIAELGYPPVPGPQLEEARRWYRLTMERWPQHDEADEAALWYAGTFVQLYRDPEAVRAGIAFLRDWLDRRPDNTYAAVMWEFLAGANLTALADAEQAVFCYRQAVDIGLANPGKAALIYWRIAYLSDHETHQPEVAAVFYRRIITETPRSGRAFEARRGLQRLASEHPELNLEPPSTLESDIETKGSLE